MDPKIWGPPGWLFMHSITLVYPKKPSPQDKETYKNFFLNMGKVLPCPACRHNFKLHLLKYPLNDTVLLSRKNLIEWLINIHNEVNHLNKKDKFTYDYFLKKYNEIQSYPKKISNQENIIYLLTLIIVILVILVGWLHMRSNFNSN